jgi:hypothetical protein
MTRRENKSDDHRKIGKAIHGLNIGDVRHQAVSGASTSNCHAKVLLMLLLACYYGHEAVRLLRWIKLVPRRQLLRYFRRSIDLVGCPAAEGRTRKLLVVVVEPGADAHPSYAACSKALRKNAPII